MSLRVARLAAIPGRPGTYLLILHAPVRRAIRVGRLGRFEVRSGCYAYAGSAFGPGGLQARIRHHVQGARVPHWHIDYLRRATRLAGVWYSPGGRRLEHDWAAAVRRMRGASIPMRGFGSSDCRCETHLFRFDSGPSVRALRARLDAATSVRSTVRVWAPV